MYPIAAKAIENNLYMDHLIKSVEDPEEAIEIFSQWQRLLSQHGFEMKKVDKQQRQGFRSNPSRLEINHQHKKVERLNPFLRDLQCLDFNERFLMVIFKFGEVRGKVLKYSTLRGKFGR